MCRRPAIVVLLMSMVNEKQPFILRCSVLYCFQCFLYKNEVGQMQLVQTLLPQANEAPSLTTGLLSPFKYILRFSFHLRSKKKMILILHVFVARTVAVRRIVLHRFSVELVFRRGVISRFDRKHKSEGATSTSTSRNQYREAAGDAYAAVCHVVAAG